MLVKLGWDVWGGQLGDAAGGMPAAAPALPSQSLPVFRKFGINAHSRTIYDEALNILCPASLAIRTMKIF
jgi:hypothetical protein